MKVTTDSTLNILMEARRVHNRARAAVVSWMEEEGRRGNLRQNSDAPGWLAYEAALKKWHEAIQSLDDVIAETP